MERLLLRQLRRYGGTRETPPARWQGFLTSVLEAYQAFELDRQRLERAMEVMSQELTQYHEELRTELRERTRVTEALSESEARLRKEIEDRERIELELRLKQKLESVGQLAAGIAHELNTPVQYVGDSVHFLHSAFADSRTVYLKYRELLMALPRTPEVERALEDITLAEEEADIQYLDEQVPKAFERVFEGTARVASIVRAVKDFARPDQRVQQPADLNHAIESTIIVARNEYKYVARIDTEFSTLPPVNCLVGDLNQVFLNLIVNAAHAIEDRFGKCDDRPGRIVIRTAVDGEDVVLSFTDNGNGIPPDVRDRIFDPFFTTKEVGRGSGQGLSISRSIVVDRHEGSITFDTVVGEGTTFHVRLPIHGRAAAKEAA